MTDPNSPAFTQQHKTSDKNLNYYGLTKREYFAAMAMQALDIGACPPENAALYAVTYADALIAELNK